MSTVGANWRVGSGQGRLGQVGSDRIGSKSLQITAGRVELRILNIYLLETLWTYTDPNLCILTRPCNVQFTVFYFVVHYAYFSWLKCLQYCKICKLKLSTWKMLTPYFEKSRLSASSRVGSGHYFACDRRVGSERVAETWPVGSPKYEKM